MKNTLKLFSVLLLSLALVMSMSACSKSGGDADADATDEAEEVVDDEEDFDYSDISFEEEMEGAELKFKASSEDDFLGAWESTSGQSQFMYGNVDLNIEKGGKWTGNVAEEDLEGTWTFDGTALKLQSELFNASLSFTEDGKLILQEDRTGDGENINTVLTAK